MFNFNLTLLLGHIMYRVVRLVIMQLQDIYYGLTGGKRVLYELDQAETGNIIYRRKLVEADMTSPNDFLWLHDEFVPSSVLLNPNWSLYTVDERFAYFVFMPRPVEEYTVEVAPFVYMKQFVDGLKLARCSLENFCRLTDHLEDNRGPLTYESSAARSGSTLMAQLLQATKTVKVLGEPDAFTALTNLIDKNLVNDDQVKKIVHAIVKFLLKSQQVGESYVIKTQSNCIRLVPYLKKVTPHMKHFFMFRKNTRRIVTSCEKILRHGSGGEEIVFLWNRISPRFASWLINFGSFEYAFMKRFGVKDCMDYAILCHVSAYYEYVRNRELFDLPWVLYENLIADPRETLIPVLNLCRIPLESLEDALKVINKDSQAETILSQDVLKNVASKELTEENVVRMNEICSVLGIPMLEI